LEISGKQLIAVLVVLLMASVVVAQTINTHIIFVVPSVISFRVSMPGAPNGYNNTVDSENNTIDIMFNSSANISVYGTTTVLGLNASNRYDPTIIQNDNSGIFNYSNTGNTYLNISLFLNTALPMNWSGSPGTDINNSIRLYAMNRTPGAGAATAPGQPCILPGNILGTNNTCIYINSTATGDAGGASMILRNMVPGASNSTYLWADFLNLTASTLERNLTHNASGV